MSVNQCVLTQTITLTSSYVDLFSCPITNGTIMITMVENSVNIGGILVYVSGGVAKNIAFTGGVGFSGSTDDAMLPLSYGASSNGNNYSVWFQYSDSNTIQVACNDQDPSLAIDFTGVFTSGVDTLSNNTIAADSIVEMDAGVGTTFSTKVIMTGPVNIGTDSSSTNAINISTNSAAGGRTTTIGNTVAGSKTILDGIIETPCVSYDTITFTNSTNITWTDVNSVAMRIGKLCQLTIKANLAVSNSDIIQGTLYDLLSITPSNKYMSSYVLSAMAFDTNTNALGAIVGVANSADFKILLPSTIAVGDSTTIQGTLTYISV
jgi:hypothetical protein